MNHPGPEGLELFDEPARGGYRPGLRAETLGQRSEVPVLAALLACMAHGAIGGEEDGATVSVTISGNHLEVDGRSEIPDGLFGVFSLEQSIDDHRRAGIRGLRSIRAAPDGSWTRPPEGVTTVCDCLYDRFVPALQVSDPADWEERFRNLIRKRGENLREEGGEGVTFVMELWNEPYLNWVVKPGVNHLPGYYEERWAFPGAPALLRGQEEPTRFLVWQPGLVPRLVGAGVPNAFEISRGPPAEEGREWQINGTTYRWERGWTVEDPTRRGWWPGKQSVAWYLELARVAAEENRAAGENFHLSVGWGCNLLQEDFRIWEDCHRPLLENLPEGVDDIHDHHYGIETEAVAATVEMAKAVAWNAHRRRITFHTSETLGTIELDGEHLGESRPNRGAAGVASAAGAFAYCLRDLVGALHFYPGCVGSRFTYDPRMGELLALRTLRGLGGSRIHTASSDDRVWSVAALNEDGLEVALYNDTHEGKRVVLSPPDGFGDTRCVAYVGRLIPLRMIPAPPDEESSWCIEHYVAPPATLKESEPAFAVTAESLSPDGEGRFEVDLPPLLGGCVYFSAPAEGTPRRGHRRVRTIYFRRDGDADTAGWTIDLSDPALEPDSLRIRLAVAAETPTTLVLECRSLAGTTNLSFDLRSGLQIAEAELPGRWLEGTMSLRVPVAPDVAIKAVSARAIETTPVDR